MSKEDNTHKPKDTRKLKKVFEDDGYNKMNEAIGRMLKRLRKEHNMSVKDVKQRLHDDYGVDAAPSTISNWESNQAHPTTAVLLRLFEMYEVDDFLAELNKKPKQMQKKQNPEKPMGKEQSQKKQMQKKQSKKMQVQEEQNSKKQMPKKRSVMKITEEEAAFIAAYRAQPEKHEAIWNIFHNVSLG